MGYVFSPNQTYADYLQDRQHLNDISYELQKNTRELIASNEQIGNDILDGVSDISATLEDGFEGLRGDVQYLTSTVESGFETLNMTFRWGFTGVMLSIGRLNDSVDRVRSTLENASKVWAYEQYADARNAFLNGWHRESHDMARRAIEGHGSNTGYRPEYRFHFLLGQNLLGDGKNNDASIIDPGKAEEAFLASVRYSETNLPKEAALAYLCASQSAYVGGNATVALEHAERALSLFSDFHEARFQRAKLLCHLNKWGDAERDLKELFGYNALWAVKAADDGDVRNYEPQLNEAIASVTSAINARVDSARPPLSRAVAELERAATTLRVLRISENSHFRNVLEEAEHERTSETLAGAHRASTLLSGLKKELPEWMRERTHHLLFERTEELAASAKNKEGQLTGRIASLRSDGKSFRSELPGKYAQKWRVTAVVLTYFPLLAYYSYRVTQEMTLASVGMAIFAPLLVGGFVSLFAFGIGGMLGWLRGFFTLTKDVAVWSAQRDLKHHTHAAKREQELAEKDKEILKALREVARSL